MNASGYWIGGLLAFLAELGSLAALAFWGATVPDGTVPRVLAAAGLPLVAAVLWGLFAAPKARFDVPVLAVVTEVVVQGGAVAALVVTGHAVLGAVLAAAVVLGALLTARPAARPAVR